ncbi:MAG: cob(I)yrinic acid a,c-diamide adenosyltransferase [Chloroflexi bacterium]|nr:MAG: cob(I)yrinic acid a,c-diamide adenosyltransferase [Chloroflexota bacterium]
MKIYTRTGDAGETSLFGGGRVPKHHARIEAYGTVDELNAAIGLALSHGGDGELRAALQRVQHELFILGADLATPAHVQKRQVMRVESDSIERLEQEIDAWSETLPPLKAFILPGGSPLAATLHLARTVCRRAERRVSALAAQDPLNPLAQRYLNRLSDWLFVAARVANRREGKAETEWRPNHRGT